MSQNDQDVEWQYLEEENGKELTLVAMLSSLFMTCLERSSGYSSEVDRAGQGSGRLPKESTIDKTDRACP